MLGFGWIIAYAICGLLAWRLIERMILRQEGTLKRSGRRMAIFIGLCGWVGLSVALGTWAVFTVYPRLKPGNEIIKRKEQ